MLNYSNNYRRDPNVKNYALKCALTLAFAVAIIFGLYNYGMAIWDGISSATLFVWHGVKVGFIATAQFLSPVFSIAGSYIWGGFLLLSLWDLCVFFKIDKKCEDSKNQWMSIGLIINSLFALYTVLYMVYLNLYDSPNKEYAAFLGLFLFYVMIVNAILVLSEEHSESR